MNPAARAWKPTLRLLAVGMATLALAACASKPKPLPPAPPAAPAPPPPQRRAPPPQRPPQAPPPPQTSSIVPGSAQDFTVNVGDRVYFDYNEYAIRDDAKPILDSQARWLARYPQVTVRIDGNCDERGTEDYNLALGARRASAVKDYLVSKGVAASRIETISYGKSRPIDPGSNEEAWSHNRNGHTAITGGAR